MGKIRIRILVLSTLLALGAAPIPRLPSAAADELSDRELKAPPQVRQQLKAMREKIAKESLQFKVGYTSVLERGVDAVTGLRLPENVDQQIEAQNARANEAPPRAVIPSACKTTLPAWDWETAGKVTPVRDQDGCGSCWAFTALGAFESSYAIVHSNLVDTSEQHMLNCSKAGTCAGGWWGPALQWMQDNGTTDEATVPYVAKDNACDQAVKPLFNVAIWGFVGPNQAPPKVDKMKEALCLHGPLAVGVRVTSLFLAYTGGVFNEHDTGRINHGVTLVGWDETKKAWRIKNSWGTTLWGEKGYMWISYDSNSIGAVAAWCDAK